MTEFWVFDEVDAFVTGAVGEPGRRVFYLQALYEGRRHSVRCEKQQVAAISQYLRRALTHLPIPEGSPGGARAAFVEPEGEAFVLGSVGLEFDRTADRFVLVLREMQRPDVDADDDPFDDDPFDDDDNDPFDNDNDDTDDTDDDGSVMRVTVTRRQALAFCDLTDRVVAAGRPDCEWCSMPLDPDSHFCVRMN